MVIKAVLFDIDGVLIDSISVHYEAWTAAFATIGFIPTLCDYQSLGGMPAVDTVTWFNKKYILGLSRDEELDIAAEKQRQTRARADQFKPYPKVKELLRTLHDHDVMVCAVTGMPKDRAVHFLKSFFGDTFRHITGYGDYTKGKPFADPFIMGWEKTGIPKEECVVVEDSPLGTKAAFAAGIDSIGITTSVSESELLQAHATYVVENHTELATLLLKLTKT